MKIVKHFIKVITHKFWVCYYCHKCGLIWGGLVHDMSKFSPAEFFESAKYYQGTSSPINVAKSLNGYSKAWQHHKGRNKHHYEYWTDNYDQGTTCIKMPYKYALEMICDYLGAGRAYWGKEFTYRKEYDWWVAKRANAKMHEDTKSFVTYILAYLYANDKFPSKENIIKYYNF